MERLPAVMPDWILLALIPAAAIVASLAAHSLLFRLLCSRINRTHPSIGEAVVRRIRQPSRWVLIAVVLSAVLPMIPLGADGLRLWGRVFGLVTIALLGWLILATVGIVAQILTDRADVAVANNLQARRRRTRIAILQRVVTFMVVFATGCLMLMSIPSIRSIGVTLIASAGLAALAVGAAAQPALKNLIAGLQMAFTEPVRIDDVVIIDGEWGRIEEITLTYAVVKIWDERRLIVPVAKFLEESFENWTRRASQITGSVFWHLDPAADVTRLRAKVEELVRANENWDGRLCKLQVTDTSAASMEVRALMTAKDASDAFTLRCDVREGLLAFIRAEMPEAIVRYRGDLSHGDAGVSIFQESRPLRAGESRAGHQ